MDIQKPLFSKVLNSQEKYNLPGSGMNKIRGSQLFFALLTVAMFIMGSLNTGAQELDEFGSIEQAGDMNEGRYNHTATLLNDGKVIVIGGTEDGKNSLNSAEVFDPKEESWTPVPDMAHPRMRHTATILDSGRVLIAGGYLGNGYGYPSLFKHFNGSGNISHSTCEIFDPGENAFEPAQPINIGRFWHRAVKLQNGQVLVMGGLNVSQGALSSCELYNPLTGQWSQAASLNLARARFTATLLQNGSVLITGGHSGKGKAPFSSCELYLPVEDKWIEVSPMNKARGYHSGILMAHGKVMVSGGFSGPGQPDWKDSEIFNSESGTWTDAGEMSLPRHNHESSLIPTGEVVIFSGSNCQTGGAHSGIEYYDSKEELWRDTNIVMLGVKWAMATTLENGQVLITGGLTCLEASAASFIYSPPEEKIDDSGIPGFQTITLLTAAAISIIIVTYHKTYRGK
jgi:hypothetical protein